MVVTLSDDNIQKESTLHLIQIFAKTLEGKTITLDVDASDTTRTSRPRSRTRRALAFPSESYGTELAKNQSAIGRVWATGVAELVSKPGDDAGFARQAHAKEFSINKITAEAKYGGVLECGYGPTADE